MASSDAELQYSSTPAFSKLEIYDTIDVGEDCRTNIQKHYIEIICVFGQDKLAGIVRSEYQRQIFCYENVSDVQKRCFKIGIDVEVHSLPADSVALDGNRFAVSFPESSVIKVYNERLQEDRDLNVDGKCYGMDFMNGKLAVCFQDPAKICVLDMDTGFIHHIVNQPSGHQLLTAPNYVAFDTDDGRDVLYVSDRASWGIRRLTKIDMNGNMLASFLSLSKDDTSRVVSVTDGGVLLVHDGIKLMSERCQQVATLLDQKNTGPIVSVKYSKQQSLVFILTMFQKDFTRMDVFKLS
ncbi:uncharacterized protein LOC128206360 [Mya arenaria]|uniref:uncharacterized protein LOC128206360 n=1 Tax=Mya arenaria TaxID=6604 RepID=UPI0022E75463|nr:uncharacterized protein LOC128206360 [Mya arenaria]XP_052764714.1 uncharacterized protein LOC128206360 [Mya arenaria]